MRIECTNPEEVVKEAMWLGWQTCGREFGMGVFQANPNANKDAVWDCVYNRRDYPGGNTMTFSNTTNRPGKVYADYVFGRMMKVGFEWDTTSIMFRDEAPRSDYQAWSRKFPNYEALVRAAIANLTEKKS
jgi:hypothetical protein